jgi:hypothetical protein
MILISAAPTRRALGVTFVLLAAGAVLAPRQSLAEASASPIVLTVSGQVSPSNPEGRAEFDLAMLDALPQKETVTATPWHDKAHSFTGPTLSSVLDAAGATGDTLRIVALNDYAADMPMEDPQTIPVILATRIDGKEMSVRDRGPIFVIYPFDDQPELFNEVYFNRSVWQVMSIEVGG